MWQKSCIWAIIVDEFRRIAQKKVTVRMKISQTNLVFDSESIFNKKSQSTWVDIHRMMH